ncbi:MAG: O-methyltransferase [Alphaproteobacteria bacterium]|nr:MAG: O-methyltransferase [Alphaproteobacteria bacterium]
MSDRIWHEVDSYIEDRLVAEDEALSAAVRDSAAAGLAPIAVSAAQGKMLHLMALSIGARRILEVGTLGGYSAIWLARALPASGELISLEIDPRNAEVARENIARAKPAAEVEVKVGMALDLLPSLSGPFDFTFIDANKEDNAAYFAHALRMSRKGSIIIVDNVVRGGQVVDANGDAQVQGVRKMFDLIANEPRVSSTAVQTVGVKGYDGFLMAVVL